jgi:hypothetical protein
LRNQQRAAVAGLLTIDDHRRQAQNARQKTAWPVWPTRPSTRSAAGPNRSPSVSRSTRAVPSVMKHSHSGETDDAGAQTSEACTA